MHLCRQALSALFYMIAAEPSHIVAAKSQVTFVLLASKFVVTCVIVTLDYFSAAASYGVLSGNPRLSDGRDEACHGVSAPPRIFISLLVQDLTRCLSIGALAAATTLQPKLQSSICCFR